MPLASFLGSGDIRERYSAPDDIVFHLVLSSLRQRKKYFEDRETLNQQVDACLKIMDLKNPDERQPRWYPIL
jgi:hypothetical protein